ncbi:hypothetical protein SAMN05421770_101301 [Granulicella rosea]|uniref:DUF3592 domain-containing protein n=1 Tax=Granulicella rosea TaxID=474952 RepID=A0A239D4X7_9BACT|nr:hypothetical protein [Granulicella rosea]SNS27566.1 hypothetical protein SAMN05421770_101301 [Granulicella rosea]
MLQHPRQIGAGMAAVALIAGTVWWEIRRRRPSPEELELRRRTHLAATGRIIDGSVLDILLADGEPSAILYQYRVSGVIYERGQDVSSLRGYLADLRLDMPVQVRYDAHNPAESIVVAESWNGLWHGVGE